MITRWAWTFSWLCGALLVSVCHAQGPGYAGAGYGGYPGMPGGVSPEMMAGGGGMMGPFAPQGPGYDPRYAPPGAIAGPNGPVRGVNFQPEMGPVGNMGGPTGPMGPAGPMGPGGAMGPGGEEEPCGGLFDEACADMCHRMGACGELCAILAPYNDGGRSLRWFDVAVDALWFTRAHTWNNVPLTSQNFALNVPPNIVLSTGQLATQDNVGFRFLP